MNTKKRKYGKYGIRAEISEVNNLGIREYETEVFNDSLSRKVNRDKATLWIDEQKKIWEADGTFGNKNLTFAAYVEMKKKTHFHEAIIRGGKKVSGYKGYEKVTKYYIQTLVEHFGKAKIKNITSHDCDVFKLERLNTATQYNTDRAIASVNRELAMLRRIFNLAYEKDRVISFEPQFEINLSEENVRNRILNADEEKRLLAALEYRNKQNKQTLIHLRPLVVTALNTAIRAGELLKLQWKNVDFEAGVIRLPQTITKTESYRVVPISDAAQIQLESRLEKKKSDNDFVFGLKYYSDGFRKLLEVAEIFDCRFHDLRHTATTAFVNSGVRTEFAMAVTGHTTLKTFRRYLNPSDADIVKEFKKVETYKIARDTPEMVSEASN